jgi:hypothetical protein
MPLKCVILEDECGTAVSTTVLHCHRNKIVLTDLTAKNESVR